MVAFNPRPREEQPRKRGPNIFDLGIAYALSQKDPETAKALLEKRTQGYSHHYQVCLKGLRATYDLMSKLADAYFESETDEDKKRAQEEMVSAIEMRDMYETMVRNQGKLLSLTDRCLDALINFIEAARKK